MVGRKRILVAPLDWGLGHATRCIPIIKELLSQGHEVVIAAEGPVKILLEKDNVINKKTPAGQSAGLIICYLFII